MKKEKVDTEKLNEAITIGNKILKLTYALIIIALMGGTIFLLRTLNIFPIIGTLLGVISPFFIGFIIAWLLNPIVNKLTDHGMKRGLATVIVFFLFLALIYLFCLAVIPSLVSQINDIAKMVPDILDNLKEIVDKIFVKLSTETNIDMSSVKTNFLTYIENFAKNVSTDLPTKIITIVQNLVSGIGKLAVGLVIGFYLLFNFHNFSKHFMNIVPKRFKNSAERLLDEIGSIIYKFINGTFIDCFVLFLISCVGFSLIGLKAPVFFAFFCAITNVIPYIGPYIGGAPAMLVGFTMSPLTGLLTLLFMIVVQTIEGNFLQPMIVGKKLDLKPVTIVISLLIFGHFFGIIGMIIATPIVAILKAIYLFFDEKYDFFGYTKSKDVKKEISKLNYSK